jgi:hypothetical protein
MHTTIYQHTKTIIQKLSGGKVISIPIMLALCACIAMMVCLIFWVKYYSLANFFQRKWHVKKIEGTLKVNSDDYWKLVDDDLQDICTSARRDNTTDPKTIAKRVAK